MNDTKNQRSTMAIAGLNIYYEWIDIGDYTSNIPICIIYETKKAGIEYRIAHISWQPSRRFVATTSI